MEKKARLVDVNAEGFRLEMREPPTNRATRFGGSKPGVGVSLVTRTVWMRGAMPLV